MLKGGLALEIRIEGARTTRDIDLALFGAEGTILERLQALGQLDLGDFMTFEIQPDKTNPDVAGDGVLYGGKRFRVECKLAGKIYGARFGLDIMFGGYMLEDATPVARIRREVADSVAHGLRHDGFTPARDLPADDGDGDGDEPA